MDFHAFFKITYGLYLVCSKNGNNFNGHVSNTVFQVTSEPARFVIASHKNNLTTDYIRKSGVFSVSVLQQDVDLEFLGPWGFHSGRSVDKFSNVAYKTGVTGVPVVLEKSLAYIEFELDSEVDAGTHILFIGQVVDAMVLENIDKPLTYNYYREVIKGLSPENSPTHIKDNIKDSTITEQPLSKEFPKKYQCKICGYIYDPEEGDPHTGIPPGTAFEDIPEGWECPICGVSKKDFVRID